VPEPGLVEFPRPLGIPRTHPALATTRSQAGQLTFRYPVVRGSPIATEAKNMAHVHPVYIPTPYQHSAERGRLILKDGSTAEVRIARCEDREVLREFFERMSPESRRRRFFSLAVPSADLIESLCDSSDPSRALTFLVTRWHDGRPRVIGTGSYLAVKNNT